MSNVLPRQGSMMYDIMKGDKIKKKKVFGKFKFWNKWMMIPLYRANILPLFGIGFIFVLIKAVGRKSGKTRYTPVEFRVFENNLYIFSSRGDKAHWYKNITANPDKVRVKKGFRWYNPDIELVDDVEERLRIFRWYANKYKTAAKAFFGSRKDDNVDDLDFTEIVEFVCIIRLKGIVK